MACHPETEAVVRAWMVWRVSTCSALTWAAAAAAGLGEGPGMEDIGSAMDRGR